MRHNALLTIIYAERDGIRRFNLSLASRGQPSQIKLIIHNALRGMRRRLTEYPDRFLVNIIRLARCEVNIIEIERNPLWRYEFNISELPPRVTIINRSQRISKIQPLFRFIGAERARIVPVNIKRIDLTKRRRGRPSALSKMPKSPLPDYVKDGVAYYSDGRKPDLT